LVRAITGKALTLDFNRHISLRMLSRIHVALAVGSLMLLVVLQSLQYRSLVSTTAQQVMKCILSFSSVLSVVLVVCYYRLMDRYGASMVIEIAVSLLHPLPFVDFGSVRTEQLFGLLMLSRLYVVFRFIFLHSHLCGAGGRFVSTLSQLDFSASFAVRAFLDRYPLSTLLFCFFFVLNVVAYCTLVAERFEPDSNIVEYRDAMWCSMVTLLTIGYGDKVPVSDEGRVFVLVGAWCGIVLTAILTAVTVQQVALSNREMLVEQFLHRHEHKRDLVYHAALVIQISFRVWKGQRRGKQVRWMRRRQREACQSFRKARMVFEEGREQGQAERLDELVRDVAAAQVSMMRTHNLLLEEVRMLRTQIGSASQR
jgi:hypothetical protein